MPADGIHDAVLRDGRGAHIPADAGLAGPERRAAVGIEGEYLLDAGGDDLGLAFRRGDNQRRMQTQPSRVPSF